MDERIMEDGVPERVWFLEDLEREGKAKPTLEYMLRPLRVEIEAMMGEHSALITMMTRLFGEP